MTGKRGFLDATSRHLGVTEESWEMKEALEQGMFLKLFCFGKHFLKMCGVQENSREVKLLCSLQRERERETLESGVQYYVFFWFCLV
jgi:hypothetical protein